MPTARAHAPTIDGQLAFGLPAPAELHRLPIPTEWKDQPRLWGHSFHPMASYLASFPAALAHAFIARYSRPGDVVFDPFSGRGTVPLQACAEGRIGVGNDLNPIAHLLTAAKVEPATRAEALTRITALRLGWASDAASWDQLGGEIVSDGSGPRAWAPAAGSGEGPRAGAERVAPEVAVSFHPRTLGQLLFVRSSLRLDDPVDQFVAAAITGILHGKSASYLSEVMPNTFSMAPRYVRHYVERTGFTPAQKDVFDGAVAKVERLHRQPLPSRTGVALFGDARDAGLRARAALRARSMPDRVRLVVGSPPYLRVVKYGYYNWLRAWFCGWHASAIDAALDDAHHREPYLAFMTDVLAGLRTVLTDDAVIVLVIGDVEYDRGRRLSNGVGLAEAVWETCAEPLGYAVGGIVLDDVAAGRKMTKLWGDEAGRATKTDRILVLGATDAGRRRALSGAQRPVDWTWPPRGPRAL